MGYSPAERLERAAQRVAKHPDEVLELGNPEALSQMYRAGPNYIVYGPLKQGHNFEEQRESSFLDQLYDIYWHVAEWWNEHIGG